MLVLRLLTASLRELRTRRLLFRVLEWQRYQAADRFTSIAGNGRFPISSPNYYETSSANFTLNFSNLSLHLAFTELISVTSVDHFRFVPFLDAYRWSELLVTRRKFFRNSEGTALYFGFIDTAVTYSSVQFINSNFNDIFGFDNLSMAQLGVVGSRPRCRARLVPLLGERAAGRSAAGSGKVAARTLRAGKYKRSPPGGLFRSRLNAVQLLGCHQFQPSR